MAREKYLSRLASPKTWAVKKKGIKWIAKPRPCTHKNENGIHILSALRDMLKYARTAKEVKRILFNQEVYVDGIRRKDPNFLVGFMDVLFIPKIKESYRAIFTTKGKIKLIPADEKESVLKICKIKGKTPYKGKSQINLYDGKNILAEKADYKVGGSLLVEIPSMKIKDYFEMKKGSFAYITGGKYIGQKGIIEDIKDKSVTFKNNAGAVMKTSINHVYIAGNEKPALRIE